MSRSLAVPRDVREFLDGYPEGHDDSDLSANFEFYSNKRTCRPDNLLIEDLHERWEGVLLFEVSAGRTHLQMEDGLRETGV